TDIVTYDQNKDKWLRVTAAIEKNSQHPLASAILKKAEAEGIQFHRMLVEDLQSITGKGVKAKVNDDIYYIGSPSWIEEMHGSISSDREEKIVEMQMQGKTVMVLGTDKEILLIIAVEDETRESAKDVISKLNKLGME